MMDAREAFLIRKTMNETFKLSAELCRKNTDATPERLAELFEHLVKEMT